MAAPESQHYPKRELIALWVGALFPALVAAAQFQTNLVLVRQACAAQTHTRLYAVTGSAIVLTLAASVVVLVIWRRAGQRWPTDAGDPDTRVRFLSAWALLGNGIFLLLIIAQGIATILLDPCQR
jgi:hypothetical protein